MEQLLEGIRSVVMGQVDKIGRPDLYRHLLAACSRADDRRYEELKTIIGPWTAAPREIMPQASSVICLFVPFQKEVSVCEKGIEYGHFKWVKAHHLIYDYRQEIKDAVCSYLCKQGYSAIAVDGEYTFDSSGKKSTWSHKSAAVISGLGQFGANRTVITKKGSAGVFFSVLVNAAIEPSEENVPVLCDYLVNGSCGLCFKSCPVGALSSDGLDKALCQKMIDANLNVEGDYHDTGTECVWGNCLRVCPYAFIE